MSNLGDLKIYLTHEKMVLTNEQGFFLRMEFDIPSPGNIIVFHVGTPIISHRPISYRPAKVTYRQ